MEIVDSLHSSRRALGYQSQKVPEGCQVSSYFVHRLFLLLKPSSSTRATELSLSLGAAFEASTLLFCIQSSKAVALNSAQTLLEKVVRSNMCCFHQLVSISIQALIDVLYDSLHVCLCIKFFSSVGLRIQSVRGISPSTCIESSPLEAFTTSSKLQPVSHSLHFTSNPLVINLPTLKHNIRHLICIHFPRPLCLLMANLPRGCAPPCARRVRHKLRLAAAVQGAEEESCGVDGLCNCENAMIGQDDGFLVAQCRSEARAFFGSVHDAAKGGIDRMIFVEAGGVLVSGIAMGLRET